MIASASRRLAEHGLDTPRLDADVLMMHLLGVDRVHLYLRLEEPSSDEVCVDFLRLIERRAAGEPLAYLIGSREFMGLEFTVDPRVLIPRPETEGLVERALAWLERHPGAWRVVDVGTGSGAIAISIDRLVPAGKPLLILASDVSRDALAVAEANRARLSANRVHLVNGSLLDWFRGLLDLVVANLPYLSEEQRHVGIGQEPDLALYADDKGLALYSQLIPQAAALLAPGGALLCEIDPSQAERAISLARGAFPRVVVRVEQDLSGRDRYLVVEGG